MSDTEGKEAQCSEAAAGQPCWMAFMEAHEAEEDSRVQVNGARSPRVLAVRTLVML